jgi:hypothetical protein
METLGNVMGILDMDGFCVGGRFLCKELGMWRVGNIYAESYFFDIGVTWRDLDVVTRRQCSYVIRNVHRLPFGVPEGSVAVNVKRLEGIVLDFYGRYKTDVACVLAYKGGCYERDLLSRLGLPGINLEKYGCPKAGVLFDRLGWLETCGNHLIGEGAYRHCSKVETEAFGLWLSERLQQVRGVYVLYCVRTCVATRCVFSLFRNGGY